MSSLSTSLVIELFVIGSEEDRISLLISLVACFISLRPFPKFLAISGILSAPKKITAINNIIAISAH